LREAFPWDEAPRYLIHDRDHAFDGLRATAKAMGIEEVVTAPHAPWQNPFVERFVGSARRECFDHVIAFNEAGVRKLMSHYCSYYQRPGLTWRWIKTRPFPVRSSGPVMATSWRSLRSAASTIDTNAERPDRAAPNCCTRAAPQLPGTVLRQRNTPAAVP
jgi:hypothetical protein